MNVTQISIGRFHHFHLARQLEANRLLECIWTGYPKRKLKDETGIDINKIHSFPWIQTPYMALSGLGLSKLPWLKKEISWLAHETLDKHVASTIKKPTIVVALSGSGLYAGKAAKRIGGYHICDRGSSHIRFQNEILSEEYLRWGLKFPGIDARNIRKEEAEYEHADVITVPSEFVRRSFIEMGVPEEKIVKVVYGARLDRFKKIADPDADKFTVLWVGAVSLRKGFLDILDAFNKLSHPNKQLIVVGQVQPEVKQLLNSRDTSAVVFKGLVPNKDLSQIYSSAHVFVLPSLEEGLAMVMGEAMACGCPVIATTNSGADDLFEDGVEGFILPIRSPDLIAERLQQLADDPSLRLQMSEAAIKRVQSIGGWNKYGDNYVKLINTLV
ncbi:Glycosyl transferases group 1 [Mucilaginibacter pineti]|uniref:Glycosyl transferases group 1 n=1 Tax=Mucilaginibacter pineti TaxID=1391627 RepID=A0A1G6W969_9SPHI|nr:glycosyltransferase [Mucilaginibacter pineti]SDD62243.1 Glycosyl transferases group 1 [Mucilaginibacter pineti]